MRSLSACGSVRWGVLNRLAGDDNTASWSRKRRDARRRWGSSRTVWEAGDMESGGIWVGCAGWSIPREHADQFAPGESQLARYSTRFATVEINSSFYRPHQPATYTRWAATTPAEFRFAVKAPRVITHERRLREAEEPLGHFFAEAGALGAKLGPVLVQLPPGLAFDAAVVAAFWQEVRDHCPGPVVCEPRHPSWFGDAADRLLQSWEVARVAADPPPAPHADVPGGWAGVRYIRLHGSPRMYYDAYAAPYLERLAQRLIDMSQRAAVWCIFDNTAAGAATANALTLLERLHDRRDHRSY